MPSFLSQALLVPLGHMVLNTADPDFAFCLQGETRHSRDKSEVTNISPSKEEAFDIYYKNTIRWPAFLLSFYHLDEVSRQGGQR